MNKLQLFKYIFNEAKSLRLLEADKSRFIKRACEAANDHSLENDLIRFVNSGAADKYKINWQEKDLIKLYDIILNSYNEYQENGDL